MRKYHTQIALLEKSSTENSSESSSPKTETVEKKVPVAIKKLTDYAWDQSDKFLKIYVTIKNAREASKVDLKPTESSFDLTVSGTDDKTYSLVVKNLMYSIKPADSFHKLKTDSVVLFLKKAESNTWSHVTKQDKKATEKSVPKFDKDESADPSTKLMGMLKEMYETGDDEMKRTIAKSWTESRNKSSDTDI
ncbi:Calcyclin-binding protein [Nymphon striatum]|nr:Calcyclin-binding protein [Nymphon striatum]